MPATPVTAAPSSPPVAASEPPRRVPLASFLEPVTLARPLRDAEGAVVDFVYVDANPAACAWIGLDRDRLVGRRMLELYPEVTATGLLARYAETVRTGRPTIVDEFPFPLRGVGIRWIEVEAALVDDCVCFLWRDVTARHEAVEQLAASEERFRLLAENALDVVVHFGPDDSIRWISPSITRVLGWAVADCLGRSVLAFLATRESRERYVRDKKQVAAGQGAVTRVQVLDAAGGVHWAEVRSGPFRTAEGRIHGMVSSTRLVDAEVRAEEALVDQARTDPLTRLPNRKEGLEQLGAIVGRGGGNVAVLWCDIDRFKSINDAHGHAAGDAVLATLSARIRESLRSTDEVAARIGGDELLVVLHGVDDLAAATEVAEQLRLLAAEPIPFQGASIVATLSIGLTLALPTEGVDVILARADDAMYRAKAAGRNRVVAVAAPCRGG